MYWAMNCLWAKPKTAMQSCCEGMQLTVPCSSTADGHSLSNLLLIKHAMPGATISTPASVGGLSAVQAAERRTKTPLTEVQKLQIVLEQDTSWLWGKAEGSTWVLAICERMLGTGKEGEIDTSKCQTQDHVVHGLTHTPQTHTINCSRPIQTMRIQNAAPFRELAPQTLQLGLGTWQLATLNAQQ